MEEKAKKDGVQLEALQIVQWRDAVFEVYKDAKNVHHVVTLKIPKTSSEYAAYTRLRRVELANCCPEIAQMPLVAPHTPAKPNFRANGMEAEKRNRVSARKAPVKKPLTKEEMMKVKRNRITTWGGNGRVQMITGAVVSSSVVVRTTAVAKPRGPAQTAAATSAQPQISDFAAKSATASGLQEAAADAGTTRKTSDKKQKTESYRKMFAAVDDQMNRQSAAMAASPLEADYVFVEASGHRELAEGGKPERAAFWAAWRKDLRGMFQYIREYECGEVDEKWYLFDVKPAEETIFGNAFARYVEN
eukprot:g17040.t1